MKRIGILGGGTNVKKMGKLLAKNLNNNQDIIIEILLPEGRNLFGYDEITLLNAISKNNLDIFATNKKNIQDFMNEFNNVKIFKNTRIIEYYNRNNKQFIEMYLEDEMYDPIIREYDYFIFADKLFTVSSTLNNVSSDHSLANIISLNEFDKVEWLLNKETNWFDNKKSIVLIGNDIKTYNFAIDLKKTFKDLNITIINANIINKKPLKGYTFDNVSYSLLKRVKAMGIYVYISSEIVEREINYDTDLVSSITIRDIFTKDIIKIQIEIIFIIDNVRIDDTELQNSYFLNKVSKLSGSNEFPIVNVDEYFEVDNVNNLYFFNLLTYKLINLGESSNKQSQIIHKQLYDLNGSYTHIFAVVSSICSKIFKEEKIKMPVNRDILAIDNTMIRLVGIVNDDLRDQVFFTNGGNNIQMFNKKKIIIINTGALSKGYARVNLALFVNKKTSMLENFLLEVRMINFNNNDHDEVYTKKIKGIKMVNDKIVNFIYPFQLGKANVIDLLIKMIDIFNKKYIYKINDLIISAKRKLDNIILGEDNKNPKLKIKKLQNRKFKSEISLQKLNEFKFDKTTLIDKASLLKAFEKTKKRGD